MEWTCPGFIGWTCPGFIATFLSSGGKVLLCHPGSCYESILKTGVDKLSLSWV